MSTSSPHDDVDLLTFYGLQEDDVAAYLLSVKVAFAADEDKFIKLVNLLKHYKAQKIAADVLVEEAKILLEHYPDLLMAFNAFLPETKKFAVELFLQPLEQECLDFITKLKYLSPGDQKIFFNIMKNYGSGVMSGDDLIHNVMALLSSYNDLRSEFTIFIPSEKGANKKSRQNKDNVALTGSRKRVHKKNCENKGEKMKRTKCNFPELVFNKEILFFEKAKARLQNRKKTLNDLFACFEKYLTGRVVSCEFQREVRTLCSDLAEDVDRLFVHDHPSYTMLRKKERCTTPQSKLAKKVLNNYCGLIKYDLTEDFSRLEQEEPGSKRGRETQEHSQAQEHEQESQQDQDIDSLQDGYDAEKHRNKRTLKKIKGLVRCRKNGSYANFNTLLKGFNFTSIKKCCGEKEIEMLKMKDAEALPIIKHAIKKRQKVLKALLKEVEEQKLMEIKRASEEALPKRVKKRHSY